MYQNFLIFCRIAIYLGINLFVAAGANAQNSHAIDSLQAILKESTGTKKCTTLIDLSFEYISASDLPKALLTSEEAYQCALEIGDSATLVKAGRYKGQILRRMDRLPEAIEAFKSVLPTAKANKLTDEYKFILNGLAIAYTFQGNYDYALKYHFESLVIREEENDKEGLSVTNNNIGLVYYKIKSFEKALEYYERSLQLKKEINDTEYLDVMLINIGLCHIQMKNFKSAVDYMHQALQRCGENCSDDIIMNAMNGLGIAFFWLDDLDESRRHFDKSLEAARKLDSKRFVAENEMYLARIALKEKKFEESKRLFSDAEQLATSSNLTELQLEVLKNFSELFLETEDYKTASSYQKKYFTLKDSVYSDQLIRNLAKVQTDYEQRENIKAIAERDQVLKLKEDLIQRQRAQYVFIVVITLLVIGIAGLLFWANNQQRTSNQELAQAKNLIEEQNKELSRTNTELDHEVRERTKELVMTNEALKQVNSELDNFIYKTSHDIRGPLATLKGMCNIAIIDVHDSLALDYLKKLDFTAEKLNTILTRLLIVNQINRSELVPVMIDFKQIIDDIITLESKKGLPPNFEINYEVRPGTILISDKELMKVVMENLVDNAIKFYNTSTRVKPFVNIDIWKSEHQVIIKVSDNGIGIRQVDNQNIFQMFVRASERSETGGIGLYLSKLSTEKLGGVITLEDTSDKGSVFRVEIPDDLNIVLNKRRAEEEKIKVEKVKLEQLRKQLEDAEGKTDA